MILYCKRRNLRHVTTFSIENKNLKEGNNLNDNKTTMFLKNKLLLGSYLAGLVEGDGCIYVPSTLRNSKGKKVYPNIKVVFHINDKPFALLLQQHLAW